MMVKGRIIFTRLVSLIFRKVVKNGQKERRSNGRTVEPTQGHVNLFIDLAPWSCAWNDSEHSNFGMFSGHF